MNEVDRLRALLGRDKTPTIPTEEERLRALLAEVLDAFGDEFEGCTGLDEGIVLKKIRDELEKDPLA